MLLRIGSLPEIPAGVCFLERWLEDSVLQSIAAENNLSETAFLVPAGSLYELRWFTPKWKLICADTATLASAFAVFEYITPQAGRVDFQTKSGLLSVERQGRFIDHGFPLQAAGALSASGPFGRDIGNSFGADSPRQRLGSRL